VTQAELIQAVRDETTDDITVLSDATIVRLAAKAENLSGTLVDLMGVLSDAWRYLSRDDLYMSQTEGNLAFSQPIAFRRAQYYLERSLKGGATITIGLMERGDLWTLIPINEFGV